MSTFKQKKELNSQIAAAKKAGKSVQTIGKLQYKLNNLASSPKGNPVRSKSTTNKAGKTVKGSVIKTGTGGTVRSKVNPNRTTGTRIISKGIPRPTKTGGHPSARPVAAAKTPSTGPTSRPVNKNRVKTSGAPHAKITKVVVNPTTKTKSTATYGGSQTMNDQLVNTLNGVVDPNSPKAIRARANKKSAEATAAKRKVIKANEKTAQSNLAASNKSNYNAMAKRLAAQAAKEANKTSVISKKKNPHTGKTTAQLKVLAAKGDINAKNLLKVRASLPSAK